MQANIDCTFTFCGKKLNGTITEIINNDIRHPGDVIIAVPVTFPAKSKEEDPRHRHIDFRVPLSELGK